MDRLVALKLLRSEYSENETFRQRLFREARAAGRLHEPHVVPIHQCGEIDGQLYIDMRLIDGTDLEAVLSQEGPLAPARAVTVVRQIAAALDAAHSAGLIHRDVKPANILLVDDDFACLLDFGLASAASDAKLTSTGFTIGTFAYMAPERLSAGAEIDGRVDVYALACVLYECLTGARPYSGDMPALISAHLTAPIPQPSQQGPDVPVALDDVIARGMAKNAVDRYGSAGDLARAAQSALAIEEEIQPDTIAASVSAIPQTTTDIAETVDETGPPAIHSVPDLSSTLLAPTARAALGPTTALATHGAAGVSRTSTLTRGNVILIATIVLLIAVAGTVSVVVMRPASSAPTLVTDAALPGLLLIPDQVNAAVGATGMSVERTDTSMHDESAYISDKACLPLDGAAQAPVYAGSGRSAVRGQQLSEVGDNWTHRVYQGVVLFSSAHAAEAFFSASAQQWPTCGNRRYTYSVPGQPDAESTDVGPVSNTNGTLSASTESHRGGTVVSCQRALTAANNVAIDINECSRNESGPPAGAAVNIAQQIAAKVPTT
jgi:serine/threonine-protein kinase